MHAFCPFTCLQQPTSGAGSSPFPFPLALPFGGLAVGCAAGGGVEDVEAALSCLASRLRLDLETVVASVVDARALLGPGVLDCLLEGNGSK